VTMGGMRTLLGLLEPEIRSEEASPGARGGAVTEPLLEIAAPTAAAIRRGGDDGSVAGKASWRRSGWAAAV
jgi:hypothetical protein